MRTFATFAAFALLTAASSVQARSIDDCEKINNPMLYNQCLAEFSPAAKRTGPSRSPNVEPAYDPPPRGNSSSYRRQRPPTDDLGGIVVQRGKSGRKVATFDIITPEKSRRRRR